MLNRDSRFQIIFDFILINGDITGDDCSRCIKMFRLTEIGMLQKNAYDFIFKKTADLEICFFARSSGLYSMRIFPVRNGTVSFGFSFSSWVQKQANNRGSPKNQNWVILSRVSRIVVLSDPLVFRWLSNHNFYLI